MSDSNSMSVEELIRTAEDLLEIKSSSYAPSKGADLLERAVECGSMDALEKLADCFFYGRGRGEDDDIALKAYLKVFEETGSAYSSYQLGRMYRAGWGVSLDFQKALAFLEKSWESGFVASAGVIGDIHLDRAESTHEIKDVEEGLKWFQRGCGMRDPYCTYRMALLYSVGEYGICEDKKHAYDLLMKVLDYPRAIGYLIANNGLNMCSNDQYVELIEKAVNLAESEKDAMLFRQLGRAYEGRTRLGENPDKSLKYYRSALSSGDGFAGYLAGVNYLHGLNGYPENIVEAEKLLVQGAELGSEQAMSALGDLHKKRAAHVWPRSPEEMRVAFEWYEKAYKNGGTTWDAMHAGEAALEAGDSSLEERAAYCLRAAMEDGIHWAYVPLAKLSLKRGTAVYRPEVARVSLEKARSEETPEYKSGEVDYLTGLMFERGLGLPVAANQAVEFYLKASDMGNADAKEALKRFKKGVFGWKQIG